MEIETLLAEWRGSEAKLYPMVVVNPHQYETNLSLVRAMTDDLSEVSRVDDLVGEYERRLELLSASVDRLEVAAPSMDVAPLLIDAAFLNRYREIPGEHQETEAARRIAEAGDGPAWVELGKAGDDGPAAATGFQHVEMRLPDGLGMYTYIDIDPASYMPLYGIDILQLEPTTGEQLDTSARPERRHFMDREEWLAAIAEVKASIS